MSRISQSGPRRALSLWPGMVFALLGINVCVVAVTVYFAHSDRSFAIEPNYYQQAILWNQNAHQQRINNALGWQVVVRDHSLTGPGSVELLLQLQDRQGQPIQQARVDCVAFSSIHSSDRRPLTWIETKPGKYIATLDSTDQGLWEFRFTIRRGDSVFTAAVEQRIEFDRGGTS